MKKYTKTSEHAIRMYNLYCGGLMAVSLIIMQAFIASVTLDFTAYISVFAFSLAIPLMAGTIVVNTIQSRTPYTPHPKLVRNVVIISSVISFVGVTTAIWHIVWIAGLVFLMSILIASLVYFIYVPKLEDENSLRKKNLL
jgi:hypothetical protein